MISFTKKEIEFLESMEECRVATSHNGMPHVKPVSYLFEENTFYIATDYDTRMYKNLLDNPLAALSIDKYNPSGHDHKAVCVQGRVTIIENGEGFSKIYEKFHNKFDWVRKQPWKENEAPFIKIIPFNKTIWGL